MAQELTFNITEDVRRLKRPTTVKDFQLSFGHADQGPTDVVIGDDGNIVQGRYGDSARQVFVNVVQGKDNEPVDITGYIPEFNGCIPDAEHIVIDNWDGVLVDPRHGRFRFDFPIQAFTVAGSYKQAYFRLVQNGTGKTLATLEFDMQVLEDFVYSNIVPQNYVTPYLDMINKLKDAYTNFVGKTQDSFDQAKKRLDDIMSTVEDKADTVEQRLKIDEQALTELSKKIDEKGLFTQAEADAFKQEVAGILANAATSKIRNKKYDTLSARIDDDEEHQLYLYNSIAEMKADDGLAAGMVVQASNHNDGDHITQQFKIGSTPDGDELFVKLANGNYANEITRDRLFPPKIVAQPEMFLASNDVKRQKEIIDGCVYLGYEAFTVDVHLEYDKTNGFHTQEDLSTLCDTFTYAKNLGYPTTALKIHYTGTFDDTTVPAYGSYITSTVIPALKSLNFDKVCVLNERQETVTPWTSKYIPQFIGLVNSIKTYGYKVGISYENDVHIAMGYNNQQGLMQSLDWIGCNLYPTIGAYGNLTGVDDVITAFDEAMDSLYLIAQLGKPIIITETGIRPYPQYFASPSNYGFDDSTNGDYSVFTRYFEGVYRSKVKTVAKEVWDWHMWNDLAIPDMARLIRQARGVI